MNPQIKHIRQELDERIKQIDFRNGPKELYDPIVYLLELGGKRLRPTLVILSYKLFWEDYQEIIDPAVYSRLSATNGSLVHNIIMHQGEITENSRRQSRIDYFLIILRE
jgi:geranylgeranyl diphosphate synthase type II